MFSLKRHKGDMVLVADIGGGGIAVAMVLLQKNGPAIIHMSERINLSFEDRSKEQTVASISKALEDGTKKLIETYTKSEIGSTHRSPTHVHAIIRSPWSHLRTARAEDMFQGETTITKELIATYAKKSLSGETSIDRNNMLAAGVMQVFLNGYPTAAPLKKKASKIVIVSFECDIDPSIRQIVEVVLGAALPGRSIAIHSSMRALISVVHEYIPNAERYVHIEVGSAETTATVIRREAVIETASIPEGVASILKRVSSGVPEETLSHMKLIATDMCSDPSCISLKETIARAEPELVRQFAELLTKLSAHRRVPNMCMLSVRQEFAAWLQAFFSRIDFAQFTATTQPFSVEPLAPDHLRDAVVWPPGITPDARVGIHAAYVNILSQAT